MQQARWWYAALLPWAGYLVLLILHPQPLAAVLTGWILMLVWQVLVLGAIEAAEPIEKLRGRGLLWLLVPALLGASQSFEQGGLALANALLELLMIEFAAFMVALLIVFVRTPGTDKDMAWPGIILLGVFLVLFLRVPGELWLRLNPAAELWRILLLAVVLLVQVVLDMRWVTQVAAGELVLAESFGSPRGPLRIGLQILLWLLAPVVFWLLR